MDQSFSGLKILDLTHYIAGPFCTKLLADYGADVIKIEKPGEGDASRKLGPFVGDKPDPEGSALFTYLNSNKKGITLNLKTDVGKRIFRQLVKNVDVVVENFEPRVMPSFGLGFESLKEFNPRLVMTSISNFGQSGRYRDYKASEIILCAMSGIMYATGSYYDPPVKLGGSSMQFLAGYFGALGTSTGVWLAEKKNIGQHVDISIMECLISCTHMHIGVDYAFIGSVGRRQAKFRALNYDIIPCKDGYIAPVFLTKGTQDWNDFVLASGIPELGDDKFQTVDGRRRHGDELAATLQKGWAAKAAKEILESAQTFRLPFGIVQNSAMLANCPQLRHRRFFKEMDHPGIGKTKFPTAPFEVMGSPREVGYRAPLLGEHNEEIYNRYIGYTKQDLMRLRYHGIV